MPNYYDALVINTNSISSRFKMVLLQRRARIKGVVVKTYISTIFAPLEAFYKRHNARTAFPKISMH